MKTTDLHYLPEFPDGNTVYRLLSSGDEKFYYERTNRHIPFITKEEQGFLWRATVGVAGCGGMGGGLNGILTRLGVGVCFGDNDTFDTSNLNRQAAATMATLGQSKAFSTASMVRAIANDTTVTVYPQGITEETVRSFCRGCNLICDEIEFWNVGARVLLHKIAREEGVLIMTAPSVEYMTYLSKYDSSEDDITIEEVLGFDYEEAVYLENRIKSKSATLEERTRVFDAMMHFAAPDLFSYKPKVYDSIRYRALTQGQVPIVATNPTMASGWLSNHVLFALFDQAGISKEKDVLVSTSREILKLDCARHKMEVLIKKSWLLIS